MFSRNHRIDNELNDKDITLGKMVLIIAFDH